MKSASRLWLLLVALCAVGNASAAVVWKWIDKNGVVHYSDQPVPGAVQVTLNAQTYGASDATPASAAGDVQQSPNEPKTPTYESVTISGPRNEETISGTGGVVNISVLVDPYLQSGHSLAIYLDGRLVSAPGSTATSTQVSDVPRGAHTIVARVLDADNQIIKQSDTITFFVYQTSILKPK